MLHNVRQSTSPRKCDCCSILESENVVNYRSVESYQESELQNIEPSEITSTKRRQKYRGLKRVRFIFEAISTFAHLQTTETMKKVTLRKQDSRGGKEFGKCAQRIRKRNRIHYNTASNNQLNENLFHTQ